MRWLTEPDSRRLAAAVRTAEQIDLYTQLRRPPVMGGGDSLKVPTGRIAITAENTYLTAKDHENKLIYIDESGMGEDNLWLPDTPAVGETYWFVIWGATNTQIRTVNRDHVIIAPFPQTEIWPMDYIAGYRFFAPSSPNCYLRQSLSFSPMSAAVELTWCILTYKGETIQVTTDYTDLDGDGSYSEGDPLIYRPCTKWVVVRTRWNKIAALTYQASDEPF